MRNTLGASRRVRSARRVALPLIVVVLAMSSALTSSPVARASQPRICSGINVSGALMSDSAEQRYTIFVPSGAQVSISGSGDVISKTSGWQTIFRIDPMNWDWLLGHYYGGPHYNQPFSGTWTNNGSSRDIEMVVYHDYSSIAYRFTLTVTGGDGTEHPDCVLLRDRIDALEMLGSNPAVPNACVCYGLAADPINTATGNFHDSFSDLAIPGRGYGLSFDRSYNSLQAGVDGPLGFGWTHRFNLRLASSPDGRVVTVHQESGSQVRFHRVGSELRAPTRVTATLTERADGTTVFERRGGRDQFVFDASGRLLSHTDLNGYRTTLGHSGDQLTAVTDEAGRTISFVWAGGRIESLTELGSPGRVVRYGYDTAGNLTSVTDPAGSTWAFGYDSSHRVITVREPRHQALPTPPVVTNHYDAGGRVDWQDDRLGRRTSFDYTSVTGATVVTFPDGDRRLDRYESGVLVSVTSGYGTAAAATTSYEHDPDTLGLTKTTDPEGRLTTSGFDARGNVLWTRDPLGRETSFTYTQRDQVETVTDAGGGPTGERVTTRLVYDQRGNVAEVRTPFLGAGTPAPERVVTFRYEDVSHPGDVTSMVDERGKSWQYSYDASGLVATTTSPTGEVARWSRNAVGWLLEHVSARGSQPGADPAQYRTTYSNHAVDGRPREVVDALGKVTSVGYDPSGYRTHIIDAEQRRTDYVFDAGGQLTEVSRPDGSVLRTEYWPDGMVKAQLDGAGVATGYVYDALDRLTAETDPLGRVTAYVYDRAGHLVTKQAAGGDCGATPKSRCTTYGYDAAGQLTSIDYADPATPDVPSIAYDAVGRRASMSDGTGASTWQHDSLGRLIGHTQPGAGTISYGYDGFSGLVRTIGYPAGGSVTRTYDDAGRLRTLTDWENRRTDFAFDADSNLTQIDFPTATGMSDTMSFDRVGRPTATTYSRAGSVVARLDYTRDDTGLLETAAPTGLPGAAETYTYSPLRQLLSVSGLAGPYAFDAADNLTRLTDGSTMAYDVANQLCYTAPPGAPAGTCAAPPSQATRYAFDQRGNRVARTRPNGLSSSYGYDEANRLVSVDQPDEDADAGEFHPIPAGRVLHTSQGTGCPTGSPCPMTAGQTLTVQVAGRGGVPLTGASAVVVNVNVSGATVEGYLKVNRNGSFPSAATLPYEVGEAVGTTVIAKLENGTVRLFSTQAVQVVVDVSGWYSDGADGTASLFRPIDATRILNTTTTGVGVCNGGPCTKLQAGQMVYVDVAGQGGIPASGVSAVALAVNVESPAGAGYLKVNRNGALPSAATLQYAAGEAVSDTVVAELDPDGRIRLYATQAIHVKIDVAGWFGATGTGGGAYRPLTPARALDTRSASSACIPSCTGAQLQAGSTTRVKVTGVAGVPTTGVAAVAFNLVAQDATTSGVVKVNRNGSLPAAASAVFNTISTSDAVSVTAIVKPDADGYVSVYTTATTHVIIDMTGYYATVDKERWTYTYNGDGLRVSKTAPNGALTRYTWDSNGGLPLLISETTAGQTTRYLYGPAGHLLSDVLPDGSVRYYHRDQLGSTTSLSDASGATLSTLDYDPYGNASGTTSTAQTPFGFAGEYRDSETGFIYLRARYYDTSNGQFLTRDPIAAASQDPYGYASQDPLNATDPSGLFPCWGPFNAGGALEQEHCRRDSGRIGSEWEIRAVLPVASSPSGASTVPLRVGRDQFPEHHDGYGRFGILHLLSTRQQPWPKHGELMLSPHLMAATLAAPDFVDRQSARIWKFGRCFDLPFGGMLQVEMVVDWAESPDGLPVGIKTGWSNLT